MEVDLYISSLAWRAYRPPAISPRLWNFMVLVCMKSALVLHASCCLVYICHGVLKVRTGPAAETRDETSRLLQTKHELTMTEDFEMLLFFTPLRLSLQPMSIEAGTVQLRPLSTLSLCGRLSTAERFYNSRWAEVAGVQAAELLSQHYNYIALMIQLHYKVTWRPRVTWCRHSRQMSITENDCVSCMQRVWGGIR